MFLKLNCLLSVNIEFQNRNKLITNSCMKITHHHATDHAENRTWRSVTDLIHRLDVGNWKPVTCKINQPFSNYEN